MGSRKKLGVLGGGESGVGAAILGKQKGYEVWVSDLGKIGESYRKVLEEYRIPYEMGKHTEESFFDCQIVVKSPGIPANAPLVMAFKKKGIPVISEIEFAYRFTQGEIIAITGSNGKTTTTSLVHHLLSHAGIDAGLGGNIGKSFAWQLAENDRPYWVLELSSFQLDDIAQFKPKTAVLLNISADHLDRYQYDIERYGAAKFRIAENLTAHDQFIFCQDDPETIRQMKDKDLKGVLKPYGLQRVGAAAWVEKRMLICPPYEVNYQSMQLMGKHNQLNSLAALLAVKPFEIDQKLIAEGLASFKPIPHRLEPVGEIQGMKFINDSKATNVEAVKYALESIEDSIVWIVGGVDKGNEYEELQLLVEERVEGIVVLGKGEEKISSSFPSKELTATNSMEEAMEAAIQMAGKDTTVLLSPACASFDLFQNYEDRGNQFRKEVEKRMKLGENKKRNG